MDPANADRDRRPPEEQVPSTPAEVTGTALTRRESTRAVQSFGLMPMLLGVAAVVALALLFFGRDPAPDAPVEPRTQTQSVPK